jgi:hypothetical protein
MRNSLRRARQERLGIEKSWVTPEPLDKFLAKVASSFYICSRVAAPAEIAEPIADL